VDELTEWLHRARETLTADGSARTDPFELCVEVAATVESWVADRGPMASRSRERAWALMRAREPGPGDRASKPVLVAARRWGRLAPGAWREVLEDRLLPDRKGQPPPGRAVPVLFSPECSALLVHALARTLHAPGREPGIEVGPAWKVYDDPLRPEALFGGTFDDAGFATGRTRLANGNRSCAGLGRQGYLRRASYRDRPSPAPAHLTVSPTKCDMPEAGVVVTALDVHPVAPDRWVLAVEGARLERGAPGSALHAAFVSISPEDLARRCVGTIGPPRASHLGVESPALLFDRILLHA
jgi:hypothetical protein